MTFKPFSGLHASFSVVYEQAIFLKNALRAQMRHLIIFFTVVLFQPN